MMRWFFIVLVIQYASTQGSSCNCVLNMLLKLTDFDQVQLSDPNTTETVNSSSDVRSHSPSRMKVQWSSGLQHFSFDSNTSQRAVISISHKDDLSEIIIKLEPPRCSDSTAPGFDFPSPEEPLDDTSNYNLVQSGECAAIRSNERNSGVVHDESVRSPGDGKETKKYHKQLSEEPSNLDLTKGLNRFWSAFFNATNKESSESNRVPRQVNISTDSQIGRSQEKCKNKTCNWGTKRFAKSINEMLVKKMLRKRLALNLRIGDELVSWSPENFNIDDYEDSTIDLEEFLEENKSREFCLPPNEISGGPETIVFQSSLIITFDQVKMILKELTDYPRQIELMVPSYRSDQLHRYFTHSVPDLNAVFTQGVCFLQNGLLVPFRTFLSFLQFHRWLVELGRNAQDINWVGTEDVSAILNCSIKSKQIQIIMNDNRTIPFDFQPFPPDLKWKELRVNVFGFEFEFNTFLSAFKHLPPVQGSN